MRKLAIAVALCLSLVVSLPVTARAQSVIYVDADATGTSDGSSWTDAFTDLQDAFSAASSGDEIWVAEGTYTPTTGSDRTISFTLVAGVALYGGFAGTESLRSERDWTAHETILSGDLNGDDDPAYPLDDPLRNNGENSYHVVVGASDAALDGFVVTRGNADWGIDLNCSGGGMFSWDVSGLAVANCRFLVNYAPGTGGWGTGGGMFNYGSSPSVTNCTFSGNVAFRGGGESHTASFSTSSAPEFVNCTFTGNTAVDVGGGIHCPDGIIFTVTNCIVWGNTAGGIGDIWSNMSCLARHSDFASWNAYIEGGGNIHANPLFVDADGTDDIVGTLDDDLRLRDVSPCIDAAYGNAAPALDGDGNPRCDNLDVADTGAGGTTYVDIGAYEFQWKGTITGVVLLEDGADPALVTVTSAGRTASQTAATDRIDYTFTDVQVTGPVKVAVQTAQLEFVVIGSPAPVTWTGTDGFAPDVTVTSHGTVTGIVKLEGADPALVSITAGGLTAATVLVDHSIEYSVENVPLAVTEVEVVATGYQVIGAPAAITWTANTGAASEVTVRRPPGTFQSGGCAAGAGGPASLVLALVVSATLARRRRRG